MKVYLIAAIDTTRGIGKDGSIPWSCKPDMKFFSKQTKGHGFNAVVMGKKTWDSLPRKPLPGRTNFVLSQSMPTISDDLLGHGRTFFNDVNILKEYCKDKFEELWIIGGEAIYKLFIDDPTVDAIYVTNIPGTFDCDTFFPDIPEEFIHDNTLSLDADLNVSVYRRP